MTRTHIKALKVTTTTTTSEIGYHNETMTVCLCNETKCNQQLETEKLTPIKVEQRDNM